MNFVDLLFKHALSRVAELIQLNENRCQFAMSTDPRDVEFMSLHKAWIEMDSMDEVWKVLKFHTGQQIAIIQKHLEHHLRAAHIGRPNPCCKLLH